MSTTKKKKRSEAPRDPPWVVTVDDARACPLCGVQAVVPLPAWLVERQPDDTTLVCHPGLKGCNHGFAIEGVGRGA